MSFLLHNHRLTAASLFFPLIRPLFMTAPTGHYCGSLSFRCFFNFLTLPPPLSLSLSLTACNIFLSYLYSATLLSILIFRFLALTPSSLLFFIHSSPSLAFPLFSSLPCANVDVCLLLYPCLFLSFSLAFPPLANIIPFFHPFSLPLQNGSRQSGRSSNTPACGSRRVCPSAASTLADDSSSRSFERRPASLFLPLSFSFFFSFFLFFLLSLFLSPYPCILLSSISSRSFRTIDVSSHHRVPLDLPSKWIRRAPVRLTHRTAAVASSFVVPFTFSRSRKRRNGMVLWQTRESRPRTG